MLPPHDFWCGCLWNAPVLSLNLHWNCWFVYPVSPLWCVRETKLLPVMVHSLTLGSPRAVQAQHQAFTAWCPATGLRALWALQSYIHSQSLQTHILLHHTHGVVSWHWWRLEQCFWYALPFCTCGLTMLLCPKTHHRIYLVCSQPQDRQSTTEVTDDGTALNRLLLGVYTEATSGLESSKPNKMRLFRGKSNMVNI